MHSTEKALVELKDKFSSEDKENLEKALKELREALTGDDTDIIKEKTDALTQAFQKASTAIYQQAAQQYQQQPGHGSSQQGESWQGQPSDDDTINADYKVKGEKKKKKDEDSE
jgi:molecular chaperone DnaK